MRQSQLGSSMLCLKKHKKRSLWPDKLAAEIGKLLRVFGCFGKSNRIPSQKHVWLMCWHCAFNSPSHTFWTFMLLSLNIGIRYVFRTQTISYQNRHESCVRMVFWLYHCVTNFHGIVVFLFYMFVLLRLQWAKKLGWLFPAVGGRSSMWEWQLTAMLEEVVVCSNKNDNKNQSGINSTFTSQGWCFFRALFWRDGKQAGPHCKR